MAGERIPQLQTQPPIMQNLTGLANVLGEKELSRDLREISKVPGGPEMLFSLAGERGGDNVRQLRLFNMGGRVDREPGGLAEYAEVVRSGGRNDDEVLLHISPEEFEALEAMWGTPEINPQTGLPEYGFLSDTWKKVKKAVKKVVKNPVFQMVAPIALNMFVPGLGTAIGTALGATGTAASTLGSAIIGGGLGALGGGKEGALMGMLGAPGVGQAVGSGLGMTGRFGQLAGSALAGGVGSKLTGGDFQAGLMGGALQEMMRPGIQSAISGVMGEPAVAGAGAPVQGAPAVTGPAPAVTGDGPALGPLAQTTTVGMGTTPTASPAMGAPGGVSPTVPSTGGAPVGAATGDTGLGDMLPLLALASAADAEGYEEPPPPELPPEFTETLPLFQMTRGLEFTPQDYLSYGLRGETKFFEDPLFEEIEEEDTLFQEGGPVYQTQRRQLDEMSTDLPFGRESLRTLIEDLPPVTGAGADTYYTYGTNPGGEQVFFDPDPIVRGEPEGPKPNIQDMTHAELLEILPADLDPRKLEEAKKSEVFAKMLIQTNPYYAGRYEGMTDFDDLFATGFWGSGANWTGSDFIYSDPFAEYTAGQGYAQGGMPDRYYKGSGSGRDDLIDAKLSDGEYVMDAETVALLGDGSSDEGARRLDQMRENLRKHKGRSLQKGKFSDDAKEPVDYLPRKAKKAMRKAKGGKVEDEMVDIMTKELGV